MAWRNAERYGRQALQGLTEHRELIGEDWVVEKGLRFSPQRYTESGLAELRTMVKAASESDADVLKAGDVLS